MLESMSTWPGSQASQAVIQQISDRLRASKEWRPPLLEINTGISVTENSEKAIEEARKGVKPKFLTPEYKAWREGVRAELVRMGWNTKAQAWSDCGNLVRFPCGCGHTEWRKARCRIRACPECGEEEGRKVYGKLMEAVQAIPASRGRTWKHIILTSKTGPSLRTDIKRVMKAKAQVKAWFRKRWGVLGYAVYGALEVGSNKMTHLHLLCWSPYIPQDELGRAWGLGFTAVKEVKSAKQIQELCYYVGRFTDKAGKWVTPEQAVEIEAGLYKVRRTWTWGKLYGKVKVKIEKVLRKLKCPVCGLTLEGCMVPWLNVRMQI